MHILDGNEKWCNIVFSVEILALEILTLRRKPIALFSFYLSELRRRFHARFSSEDYKNIFHITAGVDVFYN